MRTHGFKIKLKQWSGDDSNLPPSSSSTLIIPNSDTYAVLAKHQCTTATNHQHRHSMAPYLANVVVLRVLLYNSQAHRLPNSYRYACMRTHLLAHLYNKCGGRDLEGIITTAMIRAGIVHVDSASALTLAVLVRALTPAALEHPSRTADLQGRARYGGAHGRSGQRSSLLWVSRYLWSSSVWLRKLCILVVNYSPSWKM